MRNHGETRNHEKWIFRQSFSFSTKNVFGKTKKKLMKTTTKNYKLAKNSYVKAQITKMKRTWMHRKNSYINISLLVIVYNVSLRYEQDVDIFIGFLWKNFELVVFIRFFVCLEYFSHAQTRIYSRNWMLFMVIHVVLWFSVYRLLFTAFSYEIRRYYVSYLLLSHQISLRSIYFFLVAQLKYFNKWFFDSFLSSLHLYCCSCPFLLILKLCALLSKPIKLIICNEKSQIYYIQGK